MVYCSEVVGDKNVMDSEQNRDTSGNVLNLQSAGTSNSENTVNQLNPMSMSSGVVSGYVYNSSSTTPSTMVLPPPNLIMPSTTMSGMITTSVPPPPALPSFFTGGVGIVPPPPPPSSDASGAAAMVAMLMPVHTITSTPPPPPPPPVPMVHANLVMGTSYMLPNSMGPLSLNSGNNHNNLNSANGIASVQLYSGQQLVKDEVNTSIKQKQQQQQSEGESKYNICL